MRTLKILATSHPSFQEMMFIYLNCVCDLAGCSGRPPMDAMAIHLEMEEEEEPIVEINS